MQSHQDTLSIGKDAVRALKVHDTFLSEVRLHLEKDQEGLRQDVEEKMHLAQIIMKAVGDIGKKREYISSLEAEVMHLRAVEEEHERLKITYGDERRRSEELASEVSDLQGRGREALLEIQQLSKALETANQRRADVQAVADELLPKYESLMNEHRAVREELETKIGKLEDQLNAALHREEVFKDKWRRCDEDCEKYKAEADARGLKIEYLENKLEEKYHVENLLAQLREDYEELRKEKQGGFDQLETRLLQKEEELRKSALERDEIFRENIRFERALEEKELEVSELRAEVSEKISHINSAGDESGKLEGVIRQKQSRIDFFSAEITQLNKKILDFGELMEKLIGENTKMRIKLEEYEKKDLYFKRQMHEVSKIRTDIQHKKYNEMERLASTLEHFSH